ncbi:HD family phosphohydrolase [Syntrophorhabdus aromaticivorans]|nr:HDIG domain-containing metalloprotein [Syntrophorhabdus aromaticivorans]HBA55432.1 HDIG domain-containing protein [Syntrophorhabdus aromaticivorans]
MQNGKVKFPSPLDYRKVLMLLLVSLALSLIVTIKDPFRIIEYRQGDIAERNIKSPVDLYLPDKDLTVKKGEIIVREGDRITEDHLEKLSLLKGRENERIFSVRSALLLWLLFFLALAIIYEYADKNIKKFTLARKDLTFAATFTVFAAVLVKSSILLFDHFIQNHADDLLYIVPIFSFGMILRIVLFSEAAIVFSVVFSIVMGFMFENSLPVMLYSFLGSILASYFSGKCENRNTVLKAGFYTALIMSPMVLLMDVFLGNPLADTPIKIAFVVFNGIGSSFIALGLLPVIEHVFAYTTDIKLLELANLEHPLLEEMMVNAPGTYHHSIVVGNLAKAAAESIGAHPLLTRVSAYYHDIGKLRMPHYFIENRTGTDDAHKTLTPNMSALVILSHIKEGIEMARQYRLGGKITDMIGQHHGTSLVSYFYNRAKEMEDPRLHIIEEKDFRYGGPKPQTKEAGIIMLADSVEAASRLLDEPTPKRIETHVREIVEKIFLDGQLDECELTLKDLHAIEKSFVAILIGIFHHRIEYPERTLHDGTDKRVAKVTESGQKVSQKDNGRPPHIFKATG